MIHLEPSKSYFGNKVRVTYTVKQTFYIHDVIINQRGYIKIQSLYINTLAGIDIESKPKFTSTPYLDN